MKTYYLRDEENNGAMRRITLKEIEAQRNHDVPEEYQHRIRRFEDVYGADCGRLYAEIGYTLLYKEDGKFHLVDTDWPASGAPSIEEINKKVPNISGGIGNVQKHKYKNEVLIKCREGHVACRADMIAPGLYTFPETVPSEDPWLEQTALSLDKVVREYVKAFSEQTFNRFSCGVSPKCSRDLENKYKAIFKTVGLKPPKPLCGSKRK